MEGAGMLIMGAMALVSMVTILVRCSIVTLNWHCKATYPLVRCGYRYGLEQTC